jgi:plasmid replication initiation protein
MQIAKVVNKALVKRPRSEGAVVTLSNALTRAGTTLTLNEKRIVMLAISKLSAKGRWDGVTQLVVKVTAKDFAETFDIDINTAYTTLLDAVKHIYERSIHFVIPKDDPKRAPSKGVTRWVSSYVYDKQTGFAIVRFTLEVTPHLTQLSKQYTRYALQQTSALRSIYSWKLLELLMKFEATGVADYSIEDFCTSMQATDAQRANFGQLNLRVIKPAIKELTEKDGWLILLTLEKRGRKVTRLRFSFSRSKQQTIFDDQTQTTTN